jgi:hypothetical protein
MRPQSIQEGDDLARHRTKILVPRHDDGDRIAARYRDDRAGPVAEAVFAIKIAVDVVGCNFLVREQIAVGEEACMIQRDGARQIRIALAPSVIQEQRHGRIIFD